MASKEQVARDAVDDGRFASALGSPDEEVRGEAVRSLCPCHAGWEVFESRVGDVLRALGDRSRGVRAQALHVFEDAARMRHADELEYYVQEAEEMLRRKRASRFRPGEGGLEAGKKTRLRWRAGRAERRARSNG